VRWALREPPMAVRLGVAGPHCNDNWSPRTPPGGPAGHRDTAFVTDPTGEMSQVRAPVRLLARCWVSAGEVGRLSLRERRRADILRGMTSAADLSSPLDGCFAVGPAGRSGPRRCPPALGAD